jgi:hypothetical protein
MQMYTDPINMQMHGLVDSLTANAAASILAYKPISAFKNITNLVTYWGKTGLSEFPQRFMHNITNWSETKKWGKSIEVLVDRREMAKLSSEIQRLKNDKGLLSLGLEKLAEAYGKTEGGLDNWVLNRTDSLYRGIQGLNKFKKVGLRALAEVDNFAIVFGGKAYYDSLIEKGFTHEKAIEEVLNFTFEYQQSSLRSKQSVLQQKLKKIPIFGMSLLVFKNEPIQKLRGMMSNFMLMQNKDISKTESAKELAAIISAVAIFGELTNFAITNMFAGDDEEKEKGKKDLLYNIKSEVLGGIPLYGEFLDEVISTVLLDNNYQSNNILIQKLKKLKQAIKEEGGEYLFGLDLNPIAHFLDLAGLGVGSFNILHELKGVRDIITEDDFGVNFKKALGYSNSVADNTKKKKKKKNKRDKKKRNVI